MSLSASAPWLKYYGEVPHHLTYPQKTIYQMVRDAAIRDARLPAYEFMGKKTTFAQFMEKIDQTAQAFLAMGIQKGDRVTICMPNCPQALHAFYGLNRIGAVSNMIHPLSAAGEIRHYLDFSHSKAILTLDQFYTKVASILPELKDEFDKMIAGKEFNDFTDSNAAMSKEAAIMLEPDFILGWKSSFSDKTIGDVDYWHENGVNTYIALNSNDISEYRTVENEYTDILTLGEIFDVQDKAEEIVNEIKDEVARVKAAVADQEPQKVVVVEFMKDSIWNYARR